MELSAFTHSLDGGDLAALSFKAEHKAGKHRAAVNKNGASAAFAQLAAMFSASKVQVLANHFEQGLVRRKGHLDRLAIQHELDVRFLFTLLRHEYRTSGRDKTHVVKV